MADPRMLGTLLTEIILGYLGMGLVWALLMPRLNSLFATLTRREEDRYPGWADVRGGMGG